MDEAAYTRAASEQFAVAAGVGLGYYALRNISLGGKTLNVMKLTRDHRRRLVELQKRYGLGVSSLGTPIGKTKLRDVADDTKNVYVPPKIVLGHVRRACLIAHELGARMIRGFTFYQPRGEPPQGFVSESADWCRRITAICQSEGILYAAEVEANLVGCTGDLLAAIHASVDSPAFVTAADLGNIHVQGYNAQQVFDQVQALVPSLGLLHVKDYKGPMPARIGEVDENSLRYFVPADEGECGHERVMRELIASAIPGIEARLKPFDVPRLFCEMEPHLRAGGQFGGFSGPDGMGVALRAFCHVCDRAGVTYVLRSFEDVRTSRGY